MGRAIYRKALVEVAWDEFIEHLPSLLPGGNFLRIAAKVMRAVAGAYAQADAGEALTAREVETLVNERLAARPDIPEATKVELRSAFLSEIGLLLADLQQAEEEEARRATLAEVAARQTRTNDLTKNLKEALQAKKYELAHNLAEEILKIDPGNRDALQAEKFAIRRAEFAGGFPARFFFIFIFVVFFSAPIVKPLIISPLREGRTGWAYYAIRFGLGIAVLLVTSAISSVVEKFWVRFPRGIRRPMNLGLNVLGSIILALVLYDCVFSP